MSLAKITHDNLPPDYTFTSFRKRVPVRALFIATPFVVDMGSQGWAFCERGYLVLDPEGHPYPVDEDKFLAIYEPAP